MIPAIGSPERNTAEEQALARGRDLLHEHEGGIRTALHYLGEELRDHLRANTPEGLNVREEIDYARDYSRALVKHTEECWATAVLR